MLYKATLAHIKEGTQAALETEGKGKLCEGMRLVRSSCTVYKTILVHVKKRCSSFTETEEGKEKLCEGTRLVRSSYMLYKTISA